MVAPDNSVLETIKYLEKKGIGKKKINFRIKDWGVSRQRYWGCPIPIMYDERGEAHPVPKEDLPVKLPENINLNVKGNPLDHQKIWRNVEIDGKRFIRDFLCRLCLTRILILIFLSHLMDYLLREWFVTKLIKTQMIIG